ncbi:YncE family protein [Pedobacter heparinus]|nr:DUF5074 domain-containing protein [Pedobacter heparinus]
MKLIYKTNMMNNFNFKKQALVILSAFVLVLGACKKDKLPPIDPQPSATTGVYVLCETGYGKIGTITYYEVNTGAAIQDYYKKQNGIDLGVNTSDLKQYGSKMYAVVTGTDKASKDSYIDVMSIATGKSLKRIPFSDATSGFLPRYIAFYKNKAYVSGYDGYVTRIDTAGLTVESRLQVGGALEQLTIVNGKLYVTNSAHFMYATSNNSSVSVVDLNNFNKLKDIPVGFNPTKISATGSGELFVVTRGNYGNISPSLDKLSSVSDTKTGTEALDVEYLNITGNKGFVIGPYGNEFLKNINVSSGVLGTDFVTDATPVILPYAVTVNPLSNDIFVSDANGYALVGKTFCFGADGKKKFEFATGGSPQSAVFKYSYK